MPASIPAVLQYQLNGPLLDDTLVNGLLYINNTEQRFSVLILDATALSTDEFPWVFNAAEGNFWYRSTANAHILECVVMSRRALATLHTLTLAFTLTKSMIFQTPLGPFSPIATV